MIFHLQVCTYRRTRVCCLFSHACDGSNRLLHARRIDSPILPRLTSRHPQVEQEVQRRVNQQLAVLNAKPLTVPSVGSRGGADAGAGVAAYPATVDLPENERMR